MYLFRPFGERLGFVGFIRVCSVHSGGEVSCICTWQGMEGWIFRVLLADYWYLTPGSQPRGTLLSLCMYV